MQGANQLPNSTRCVRPKWTFSIDERGPSMFLVPTPACRPATIWPSAVVLTLLS